MSLPPSVTMPDLLTPPAASPSRVASINAARGLVMFAMIFVNDIASVPREIVPWWMRHYPANASGMTFVNLVFPGFLFIVGMSIPFALGSRFAKGQPRGRILLHVVLRTLSLLWLGVMMVNGVPDSARMGWSGMAWSAAMFFAAILAFSTISPSRRSEPARNPSRGYRVAWLVLRTAGFASLLFLAFAFRGKDGHRIVTLDPFSVHTQWWGILGLIGWAYLVAAVAYLIFPNHRTALLGCTVLLFCLYPADRTGLLAGCWLAKYVGIGGTLGSQAAIAVAGVLLASIFAAPDMATIGSRLKFTLLFIAGCSIGASLLHGLYGINKNSATPSWCLWACAITAAIWLILYLLSDVLRLGRLIKPLSIAGENVLLAYLLHNALDPTLSLLHLDSWYASLAQAGLAHAVARSASCAVLILSLTALLNRAGFRLRV